MDKTANIQISNQAAKIELFSFAKPHMRSFHMTWFAFFIAFFGWFGIAPLMPLVREDLGLSQAQIGNTIIASVAATIAARLLIGWLCGRIGPRLAYTGLLVLGSVPVMCIGFAQSYEAFLLFRLAIGVVGASFVITQYHTSIMFAPNVVGTANATTAGWGNLGGGVTQMVMPIVLAAVVFLGASETGGWRVAMIAPGAALLIAGVAYFFLTQDTPAGNYKELRARQETPQGRETVGAFLAAASDYRVWTLFLIYGACFGIELTINNVAALYFHDRFELGVGTAGLIAGLFGLMNIFARSLGGIVSDRTGIRFGLRGRVTFLGIVLALEGLGLALFSQMSGLFLAVGTMLIFSLFVQMSEGATFSVVPFINRKALGPVTGIVGAGGNAGAVAAGFLFRLEGLDMAQALLYLGIGVGLASLLVVLVRFSPQAELEEKMAVAHAMAAIAPQQEPPAPAVPGPAGIPATASGRVPMIPYLQAS